MEQLMCCLLLLMTSAAALIPREKLVADSSIKGVKMSADGMAVGFIASDANKIKNVFTLRLADRLKRQVTFEERHVLSFEWTGVNDIIIFSQDRNGDENMMLFKKNISEKASEQETTVISRKEGVLAGVLANDGKSGYVLVALNDVTSEYHNIYKFDLHTNALSLVFANTRFAANKIYADNNMNIRLAGEQQEDGSFAYLKVSHNANFEILTSDKDQWEEYFRVKSDDASTTRFVGFDETNDNAYWKWGADTDLGTLIVAPITNFSQRQVLYTPTQGELQDFVFHPKDRTLLAFSENYHKPEYKIFNETVAKDLNFLTGCRPADSLSLSMSHDMDTWLLTYASSERPNEVFLYNRKESSSDRLFNLNTDLEGCTLNKQIGFDFIARDGLRIQAYLSLPLDALTKSTLEVSEQDRTFAELEMIPTQPQKMVLLVHGGPNHRDTFGFDSVVAHLTSRGYAVMKVNFRGSTGFGKQLYNAGSGEWSRKMHTDLLDAVDFAVAKGIANRSAVAIMGGSYGGYATLVGLTFTPDVFACGIDIVGPSNLISLLKTIPAYWKAERHEIIKELGCDSDTEEGRRELEARSPLSIAYTVEKPLMIMQGANDPRVKQQESEQFVAALKNHSTPVTYVLYPDEGHGFKRTPNLLSQFGFVERFLHECLGGAYQEFTNGQYNESAIVKSGGFASVVQPSLSVN